MDASVPSVLLACDCDPQLCRYDRAGERNVSKGTVAFSHCRLQGPARAVGCLHRVIQHPAIHGGEENDTSESDWLKSFNGEYVG